MKLISSIYLLIFCLVGCAPEYLDDDPDKQKDENKTYTELRRSSHVTLESLLDEMIDYDADVCFPSPTYSAKMVSSTDARSVSPDKPFWFANTDCTRYIRMENGEKVIFEEDGPGVITRIWTVGKLDHPMYFYFDGETTPSLILRNGDPNTADWDADSPLIFKHPWHDKHYGGNMYYPIPFGKSLKITAGTTSIYSWAYHFSVRKYDEGTTVETFNLQDADRVANKAAMVAETLRNPPVFSSGEVCSTSGWLDSDSTMTISLPNGNAAIRNLRVRVGKYDPEMRESLLRRMLVEIYFDGIKCVDAPLSDFFGGGSAAAQINSWYFTNDGKGTFDTRFVMPYRDSARICIKNLSGDVQPKVDIIASVDTDFEWHTNTMHFHAQYRADEDLPLSNDYEGDNIMEWTVADIRGKGIVKGDVLSVTCNTNTWYGEGDEKIYVDSDTFPSYFGTGHEDYYNTSYAPVVRFENAYGGCLLAESNMMPYRNIWLRTRNLDGMIFNSSLKFNWELESWDPGTADYSSVLWWYALD